MAGIQGYTPSSAARYLQGRKFRVGELSNLLFEFAGVPGETARRRTAEWSMYDYPSYSPREGRTERPCVRARSCARKSSAVDVASGLTCPVFLTQGL